MAASLPPSAPPRRLLPLALKPLLAADGGATGELAEWHLACARGIVRGAPTADLVAHGPALLRAAALGVELEHKGARKAAGKLLRTLLMQLLRRYAVRRGRGNRERAASERWRAVSLPPHRRSRGRTRV